MLINKMIKSGLVIQNRLGLDLYPSGYTKHGRWGTQYSERPSSNDVLDTGFSTTREISPYQQSIDTFDRVVPKSVFKTAKASKFYKYKNGPKMEQVAYLDIFGKKANEIVDYVGSQLKKSYFTGVPGPAGPAGPPGPSGERGEPGLQGIAGLAGEIGPAGPIGPQGEMGFTGPQGIEGPMGMQGIEGAQGPMGMQGIEGAQGPMGMQGIEGPMGMQGIEGAQGPMGMQGIEGAQGLVGNGPSEDQVRLLIENSLTSLPSYITNLLDSRLTNLPTFIQGEIVSQLQGLPQYIKSNQLSINDVAPIIAGMIADAAPKPTDIFTNPAAITNIPQETETGMVTIYQPERSFQSAQEPGPAPVPETVPEPTPEPKAPEPPKARKQKAPRRTSLPTVVEEEAGPSNARPEVQSKKVKIDEPLKKLTEIEELKRSIELLKKKKKLSPNQQTLLFQRENRLSALLRK